MGSSKDHSACNGRQPNTSGQRWEWGERWDRVCRALYGRMDRIRLQLWPTKTLGERGEAAAARMLRRKGYRIIERGSRNKIGEIDLIAVHNRRIIFVEVKTRRSLDKGHPADAVDDDKERQIISLASAFLKRHGLVDYPVRFDVVAVLWPVDAKHPTLQHFEDAF